MADEMSYFTRLAEQADKLQATQIDLKNGSAITFTTPQGPRTKGNPLAGKQIIQLCKKELSSDTLKGMTWGWKTSCPVETSVGNWTLQFELSAERTVAVSMIREASAEAEEAPEPPPPPQESPPPKEKPPQEANTDSDDGDTALDAEVVKLTTGENLCLIYTTDDSTHSVCSAAAEHLGLTPRCSTNDRAVQQALRYTDYEVALLVLDESAAENDIYRALAVMPMERRRKIFVTLVAPNVETENYIQAFAYSMNVLVATADLPQLHDVMERHRDNWQRGVQRFHDCLKQLGRL